MIFAVDTMQADIFTTNGTGHDRFIRIAISNNNTKEIQGKCIAEITSVESTFNHFK